jgi:hypothetical protein
MNVTCDTAASQSGACVLPRCFSVRSLTRVINGSIFELSGVSKRFVVLNINARRLEYVPPVKNVLFSHIMYQWCELRWRS